MSYPDSTETARLILRRWRRDDGPAMSAIWAEPRVWQAIRPHRPYEPEHWRRILASQLDHWEHHGFGLWAAVERESERVIGWIGASHPEFIPELAERVEIGWTLRPAYWGRGLATEGALAAVDASFGHLDADELISLIHPSNERSIAVAERVGMSRTAAVRHPELGEDLAVYALSRSAWGATSRRGASPQRTSSR
jgi:RimJ/RimL family protein N-acetyltransferase